MIRHQRFSPLGQIELFQTVKLRLSICAGEKQQRLDNLVQIAGLALHRFEHFAILAGITLASQGNFQLPENRCERRAQLMRGFAGEPALSLERVLQSYQQLVERHAQVFDLIARVRDGQSS